MNPTTDKRLSNRFAALGVSLVMAMGTLACATSTAPSTTVELSDFEQVSDEAMAALKEPENKIYRAEQGLAEAEEAVVAADAEIATANKELDAGKADKSAAEAEAKAAKVSEDKGRLSAAEGKITEAEDAIAKAKAHLAYAKADHSAAKKMVDLKTAEIALAKAELELARVRLLDDQKVEAADKYAVITFKEQVAEAEAEFAKVQAAYDSAAMEAKEKKGLWQKMG